MVRALAEDLPRLWNAPSTTAKDKKRILRMLLKDVTLERGEGKLTNLHIRWQGGASESIRVVRPPSAADRARYSQELVDRVRKLACTLPDDQIAQTLNAEGRRPSKGDAFNVSIVRWIRYKHQIASPALKRAGELTVKQVAEKFGVSRNVVYYWIDRGLIEARRRNQGSPYWIALDAETEHKLYDWVRNSSKINNKSEGGL